jgi:hypothetical protein
MTVAITHLDLSASDLRGAAARTQDAKAARRMLAIGLVLADCLREVAAEACAMDRQTLCDWVHRYNASGLEGLFDRPRRNGPRPRLSAEQHAQVAEWVEQVRSTNGTVWCAGGVSICGCGSRRVLRKALAALEEQNVIDTVLAPDAPGRINRRGSDVDRRVGCRDDFGNGPAVGLSEREIAKVFASHGDTLRADSFGDPPKPLVTIRPVRALEGVR